MSLAGEFPPNDALQPLLDAARVNGAGHVASIFDVIAMNDSILLHVVALVVTHSSLYHNILRQFSGLLPT